MTHTAAGSSRGIPRGWLLPLGALLLILIAAVAGMVSRAIIIDLLAWWPAWLAIAALAFVARGRMFGKVHAPAVVPLVALVAIAGFVWGYVAGWEAMPSAVNRLNGPEQGPATQAALTIDIDGDVRVGSSELGFLYSVSPMRRGGDVGLPEALEQTQGAAVDVVLTPVADSGLYTYSGWRIQLSTVPIWSLDLSGDVDADVTDLVLSELRLGGRGSVTLGAPPATVTVSIDGDYEARVPVDVAVQVVGTAEVPEGWTETADGWRSPGVGPGWVITVAEGASISVEES